MSWCSECANYFLWLSCLQGMLLPLSDTTATSATRIISVAGMINVDTTKKCLVLVNLCCSLRRASSSPNPDVALDSHSRPQRCRPNHLSSPKGHFGETLNPKPWTAWGVFSNAYGQSLECHCQGLRLQTKEFTKGALIVRTGLWGILYYDCNKEPPK